MTLTADRRQEPANCVSWCETVDGLPLVEGLGGEPGTTTWLTVRSVRS